MTNISNKIGLGTVQWGQEYGISNKEGQTSPSEVEKILTVARLNNIKILDTAHDYGQSELILGKNDLKEFNLITKTRNFNENQISQIHQKRLISNFKDSINKLVLKNVYGLLIHDVNDLFKPGGENLIKGLNFLKENGFVKKIGISIYDSNQIKLAMKLFKPDIIQIPINIFDQRLIKDGTLKMLADLNIEVHARSIFLQGLFFINEKNLPNYFLPWKNKIRDWHHYCNQIEATPLEAALSFILSLPEIKRCIVGVNNSLQLLEVLEASKKSIFLQKDFSSLDENLINPKNWK